MTVGDRHDLWDGDITCHNKATHGMMGARRRVETRHKYQRTKTTRSINDDGDKKSWIGNRTLFQADGIRGHYLSIAEP